MTKHFGPYRDRFLYSVSLYQSILGQVRLPVTTEKAAPTGLLFLHIEVLPVQ
jgi:hypothetical protein